MRRVLLALPIALAACSDPGPAAKDAVAAAAPVHPACGLSEEKIGTFVTLPEGAVEMGANAMYAEEEPARTVHIASFSIQAHEVTNAQFDRFVSATGYVTDSERTSASGVLGGGSAFFQMPEQGRAGAWMLKRGATWKSPDGVGSGLARHMNEPVVHVSLNDAAAYAQWAGGRLPTEDEWEYAAATGLRDPGDRLSGAMDEHGRPIANFWQGIFPVQNEGQDGFQGVAPVGCFPPSKVGLYDMIGNVWEWTSTPYRAGMSTIKGGSFLCAENFCARYRSAARQGQEVDFSSSHIGFRIVKDVKPD